MTRKPPTPYAYEDVEQIGSYHRWAKKSVGRTGQRVDLGRRCRLDNFLVLTKEPGMGRGEYGDELDVAARTKTEAIKIAQAVLNEEYQPQLRIARVVWQGQSF